GRLLQVDARRLLPSHGAARRRAARRRQCDDRLRQDRDVTNNQPGARCGTPDTSVTCGQRSSVPYCSSSISEKSLRSRRIGTSVTTRSVLALSLSPGRTKVWAWWNARSKLRSSAAV